MTSIEISSKSPVKHITFIENQMNLIVMHYFQMKTLFFYIQIKFEVDIIFQNFQKQ